MQPSATDRIPRVIRFRLAIGVAEGGRKRIARHRIFGSCRCLPPTAAGTVECCRWTYQPAMTQLPVPPRRSRVLSAFERIRWVSLLLDLFQPAGDGLCIGMTDGQSTHFGLSDEDETPRGCGRWSCW